MTDPDPHRPIAVLAILAASGLGTLLALYGRWVVVVLLLAVAWWLAPV